MHLVVGTAGHIDHGKTSLIKALSGTDTDRLPEEKQRGITIDLGFAQMAAEGVHIGFVDVPGHERFVKNMLAGASGIDLVLLVIAADEGVMPQTREHFDICRLLGIQNGVVVLTKKDIVDDELLDLVRLEAAELVAGTFLQSSPVVAVSSKSGEGVDELKTALVGLAGSATARPDDLVARLPIDRSFAVKGFGTVVTGTLASGTISEGDELELLPMGRRVRVRNLQSHNRTVEHADAGQRTAVNLAGVDHADVSRGMTLAAPGVLAPSQIFDATVSVLSSAARPLKDRQRVRLHIGTAETLARIAMVGGAEIEPGSSGSVQLRLESPVAAVLGDRFILRAYSPQVTIAGGTILRPAVKKARRSNAAEFAKFLDQAASSIGDPSRTLELLIGSAGPAGMNVSDIRSITGWKSEVVHNAVAEHLDSGKLVNAGGIYIGAQDFGSLRSAVSAELESHHRREPLSRGVQLETLRERLFKYLRPEIARAVISDLTDSGKIVAEKDTVRLPGHSAELSPAEKKASEKIRAIYHAAELKSPPLEEVLAQTTQASGIDRPAARKVFQLYLDSGELAKISEDYYILTGELESLVARVRELAENTAGRTIDVAAFKDLGGLSRKYAIPLLEYFDREKITRRAGDKRVVL